MSKLAHSNDETMGAIECQPLPDESEMFGPFKKHTRPPVKGEEGYGIFAWLQEQDFNE